MGKISKRKIGRDGLLLMGAPLLLLAQACGAGDGNSEASSDGVNEVVETTSEAPELFETPAIGEMSIAYAEAAYGIQIDAIDIGPEVMSKEDEERAPTDRETGIIAAYRPIMEGDIAKAGVIEETEYFALVVVGQAEGVTENQYADLLDCPEGEGSNGAEGNVSI